jgi:hypothetical protein
MQQMLRTVTQIPKNPLFAAGAIATGQKNRTPFWECALSSVLSAFICVHLRPGPPGTSKPYIGRR